MNEKTCGAGQADTPVPPSSLQLRPLQSVTVIVLHKISAQRASKTIPIGSELALGELKLSPISCQAMKRTDQYEYEYQAKFKVSRLDKEEGEEISLTTEEAATRLPVSSPVYAVFLEKCTFCEEYTPCG